MAQAMVELDVSLDIDTRLWSWFVGLGVVLALLGVIASANLLAATMVAAYTVGGLMCVAAALQLVHALRIRRRGPAGFWLVSSLLYLTASGIVLYDPFFAVRMVTLFLALALAAAGLVRAAMAIGMRGHGWGWMLLSGLVSMAAGALIVVGWPLTSFWLLGLVLAFELIFQGLTMTLLGVALRIAQGRERRS